MNRTDGLAPGRLVVAYIDLEVAFDAGPAGDPGGKVSQFVDIPPFAQVDGIYFDAFSDRLIFQPGAAVTCIRTSSADHSGRYCYLGVSDPDNESEIPRMPRFRGAIVAESERRFRDVVLKKGRRNSRSQPYTDRENGRKTIVLYCFFIQYKNICPRRRLFHPTKAPGLAATIFTFPGRRPAAGGTSVWRNTQESYGAVTIAIHWLMALVIPGLFALGLWMVDLTYYDAWYKRAPEIHKGLGILLFGMLLFRVLWRSLNPRPRPEPGLSALERAASSGAHLALYLLLFAVMLSGYLISTADGRAIDVFGLFQVPATVSGLPNQADLAGQVHFVLAIALVSLAGVHAIGALKHHFVDHDRTLVRMLGRRAQ